jgi:hypothetical protein
MKRKSAAWGVHNAQPITIQKKIRNWPGRLLSVTACMFCVASVLTASFSGLVKLSIKSRVDIHMSKGVELMVVRANWTSRVLDPRGCPAGEGVEIGTARLAIIFF